MGKKETTNSKEVRKQNYEAQKMNNSKNVKKKTDKNLPWWVELLFVQIGLPDKFLIKILNAKKKSKELIKNDKKALLTFLFILTTLAYFYPVIKHAKSKLDCEAIAKDYIIKNKKIIGTNKRELKMLSTNNRTSCLFTSLKCSAIVSADKPTLILAPGGSFICPKHNATFD